MDVDILAAFKEVSIHLLISDVRKSKVGYKSSFEGCKVHRIQAHGEEPDRLIIHVFDFEPDRLDAFIVQWSPENRFDFFCAKNLG